VPRCLVLLTFRAASDKVDYDFIHFWPPEVPSDKLDSLVLPHVPSDFGVVLGFKDSLYEFLWYPEHTLPVEQHLLDFNYAPSLSVHLLLLWESGFLFHLFPDSSVGWIFLCCLPNFP